MKPYQAYFLDLDGTMYKGTDRIEGAAEFVNHLIEKELPFMFLTNNSSKNAQQVAEKLQSLDIQAKQEQIFTTSMATAEYLSSEKPGAKIFAIGEEGLLNALAEENLQLVEEDADYVIIGLDREVNYEKLAKACLNVRSGAELISTNGDIAIPTERGMLPGNGAITSVISVSTNVEPTFIGKPESTIMDQALKKMGTTKEKVLMVGDNYHTDILAGIHAGLDTLMVETGVSTFEDIRNQDEQPTYKAKNLIEWLQTHCQDNERN
ncbi:TIGR01457 family HAD-type hydrolase [Halobacillus rhizosphaerae]|uniref:TIGR01457 family HAD-type hydrolase n=1 Tax=Halobacillus rhizosphaerae TaxID=3064889 RepID=UPI00398B1B72